MSQTFLPAVNTLFNGVESPTQPVVFSWRLMRRKGLPLLLLPQRPCDLTVSVELYSAQRPLARMWRSLVPRLMRTPAVNFFERVSLRADAASPWMQFLGEQSGLAAGQLRAPTIKFGGVAGKTSRLVLLLCDGGGYPVRVIKVGLDPQGRAVTEREADLLSHLPADVIGGTGITGRFSDDHVSAFATAFFSGKGLANDVGIEKLFHAWLNSSAPEPIENLASWRELESVARVAFPKRWSVLRDALAGQTVCTTLFHGDFTPWNIRMTNLETIRAFDWERGHLKGIPTWDWFHFIVQTSVLVKRHSPERVAAELDQLTHTSRFENYARAAGVAPLVDPLLLAYLVHQKLVIQPLEGARMTERLFDLLWMQWRCRRQSGSDTESYRLPSVKPGATRQIKSAFANLANLFWEPTLSPEIRPGFAAQLAKYWPATLAAFLWLGGVCVLNYFASPHLMLAPFYLLPCVVLALKADRRLAFMLVWLAAFAAPLLHHFCDPVPVSIQVTGWYIFMRLIFFSLIVILLDRVRKNGDRPLLRNPTPGPGGIRAISGNWAAVATAVAIFVLVAVLDAFTAPDILVLYLVPCIIITLALNWRWGTLAAVLAAVLGQMLQSFQHQSPALQFWNCAMRFVIFETVVLLLERIRQRSILFHADD
jgi:hypothetical protein